MGMVWNRSVLECTEPVSLAISVSSRMIRSMASASSAVMGRSVTRLPVRVGVEVNGVGDMGRGCPLTPGAASDISRASGSGRRLAHLMTDLRTPRLVLHPVDVAEGLRIATLRAGDDDLWAADFPTEGDILSVTAYLRRTADHGEQRPFGFYRITRASDG